MQVGRIVKKAAKRVYYVVSAEESRYQSSRLGHCIFKCRETSTRICVSRVAYEFTAIYPLGVTIPTASLLLGWLLAPNVVLPSSKGLQNKVDSSVLFLKGVCLMK